MEGLTNRGDETGLHVRQQTIIHLRYVKPYCWQTCDPANLPPMTPQVTVVQRPLSLQIADAIRMRIESGELRPGDPVPALRELADTWQCSVGSARAAVALLRQQGLITSGRGRPPVVRKPPQRITRDSAGHQLEKDLARASAEDRKTRGTVERELGVPIDRVELRPQFDVIDADDELASALGIRAKSKVLRRRYEWRDRETGALLKSSMSYVPRNLISKSREFLDPGTEPWPGGTYHQLSTLGIEIDQVEELVTAAAATTVEKHDWRLEDGVPMLRLRRTLIDTDGQVVEVSDASFPADRTEMRWRTQLERW